MERFGATKKKKNNFLVIKGEKMNGNGTGLTYGLNGRAVGPLLPDPRRDLGR